MTNELRLGDFKWVSWILNHVDEARALVDWYPQFSGAVDNKAKVLALHGAIDILANIVDDLPIDLAYGSLYPVNYGESQGLKELAGRLNIDWSTILEIAQKILPLILPFILDK